MGLLDAIKITAKYVENTIKYAVDSKEERFISIDEVKKEGFISHIKVELDSIPEELINEIDSIDVIELDESEIDVE